MTEETEVLSRLLKDGEPASAVAFFARMNESRRHELAPHVITWCRHLKEVRQSVFRSPTFGTPDGNTPATWAFERMQTARVAATACASLRELKSLGPGYCSTDAIVAVLRDRRPGWLDDYAAFVCNETPGAISSQDWWIARGLVREGLCRAPSSENYALGALEGVRNHPVLVEARRRRLPGEPPRPEPMMADLLLAERDWLEGAFWRLFEIEGTGPVSLASAEKYSGSSGGWIAAITDLCRRGVLPRERLLDSSLDALARGFIQFRAGWFSRFHEALVPTPEERVARLDRYLHLLASTIIPTVAMAINAVTIADEARPLAAKKLLPALAPALSAPGKGIVLAALRLLDRIAVREPAARREACLAAIGSLLSTAGDVHKRVLDLLEKHAAGDSAIREALRENADAVAASLRPRVQRWLGSARTVAPPVAPEIPAPPARPARLAPARAIPPIADLDELLHVAARVLETPDQPDEIERVLDGISRLCDQKPPDFPRRTGPLLQRSARKLTRPSTSHTRSGVVDRAVANLVASWLCERAFDDLPTLECEGGDPLVAFLVDRHAVLAKRFAAGRALPMLSAPTHLGAWIEPRVFVERCLAWQSAGAAFEPPDLILALLRLTPEQRAPALAAAGALRGEAGHAIRHALGKPHPPGRDIPLWLAAYRSRQPHEDLPDLERAHPKLGPDAGTAARYSWSATSEANHGENPMFAFRNLGFECEPRCPAKPRARLVCVLFHHTQTHGHIIPTSRSLLRWLATLWPANPEAFLSRALPALQFAVEWHEAADRERCGYIDALSDPFLELRPVSSLALALSLAAQDAAMRGLSQDALIAIIADGRLDAELLGATFSRLLDTGCGKLARWAKSLAEVARTSSAHAHASVQILTHGLRGDPAKAPEEIGALLALLVELLAETGSQLYDPQARAYVSRLAIGGKTARHVKQLLAAAPA